MHFHRRNIPIFIVSTILMVGLAAGVVVAQREQANHEKTIQKRREISTLPDTIPAPNGARKVEYQASAVAGKQQFVGVWSTSASLLNVANYYYQILPTNAWQVTSTPITNQNQSAGVITATQENRIVYISLQRNQTTDITTISVAIPSVIPAQPLETTTKGTRTGATSTSTKIAFIANTGVNSDFQNILNLIKNEQADYIVHAGDFDLQSNPELFASTITTTLGEAFPYLYVIGDQDEPYWNSDCFNQKECYTTDMLNRLAANQLELTLPNKDTVQENEQHTNQFFDTYALDLGAVHLVALGLGDFDTSDSGTGATEYAPFITNTFEKSDASVKICVFHETMFEIQVGNQIDSIGWKPFEACREQGALIVTGSDHSYSRSKTIRNYPEQIISTIWSKNDLLRLEPGTSFIVNAGLGGANYSLQERCKPITAPFGCQGEWASIYSINQAAKPGVFFIEIDENQPTKATAYFKNTDAQVIDTFNLSLWQEGAPLTEIKPK